MKETLFAPFKDTAFTEKTVEILKELHSFIGPLGEALAQLVMVLMKQFQEILPYLVNLLISFTKSLERGTSILSFFGKALVGINPVLLKMYIMFIMLRKLNIANIFMMTAKAVRSYTASMNMALTASTTLARQESILAVRAAAAANMHFLLWQAIAGIGFGITMAATSYNSEARALGILTTAVMAAAAAYQILAISKYAANPWAVAGGVAAIAAITAGIAYGAGELTRRAGWVKPPEQNLSEFESGFAPTYGGEYVGTGIQGMQRGGIIPETGLYLMHKGEPVGSANQEHSSSGGDVITIDADSWRRFTDNLWREFGIKVRRDSGRYTP